MGLEGVFPPALEAVPGASPASCFLSRLLRTEWKEGKVWAQAGVGVGCGWAVVLFLLGMEGNIYGEEWARAGDTVNRPGGVRKPTCPAWQVGHRVAPQGDPVEGSWVR